MNKYFSTLIFLLIFPLLLNAKLKWGDQYDGTFINPVLNADYSDPDIIRVGDKYYLTCSEFHFMGMPVLESDDLLHWRIISRVFDSMPGYDNMDKYAQGTWAPAIRYHNGLFYIYVCSPHEGLWVTTAEDPAGPWSPMTLIHEADKWEDPCPFWDADGNAYLGRSQYGAGPIIVHRMSDDGMSLLDDGVTVYEGPVAEGTKFYAEDGYIYLSIPEGGVHGGWQTVLRAKDIYGPYEGHIVLEQGSTDINGPHQGALVDTPDGEWWFAHFQETPVLGRVMHLQPIRWVDGFPQIGTDYDGNGVGEPMSVCARPSAASTSFELPATDDDFNGEELDIIWQFNHNPDKSKFDLISIHGWLSWESLQADSLKNAKNTLTQKVMGYKGTIITKLNMSDMAEGQRSGLISMGKYFWGAGVMIDDNLRKVYIEHSGEVVASEHIEGDNVYLKYDYDINTNLHNFSYSLDGINYCYFTDPNTGESFAPFSQRWGNWKGLRMGIYNYTINQQGVIRFDYFKCKIIE